MYSRSLLPALLSNTHAPIEAIPEFEGLYPNVSFALERKFYAMVSTVDSAVGNVTAELKVSCGAVPGSNSSASLPFGSPGCGDVERHALRVDDRQREPHPGRWQQRAAARCQGEREPLPLRHSQIQLAPAPWRGRDQTGRAAPARPLPSAAASSRRPSTARRRLARPTSSTGEGGQRRVAVSPPAHRPLLASLAPGRRYATILRLAGLDPSDPFGPDPTLDSLDLWPWLSGANATSPRAETVLDHCMSRNITTGALRVGDWKLLVGGSFSGGTNWTRGEWAAVRVTPGLWGEVRALSLQPARPPARPELVRHLLAERVLRGERRDGLLRVPAREPLPLQRHGGPGRARRPLGAGARRPRA